MRPEGHRHRSPLAPSLALFAAACGGAGSPSHRETRVEVLLGTSPAPELASLSAAIEDLRLVADDGETTGNLLPAPVELELVGLAERSALVASTLTRRGTYQNAELTLRSDSLRAVHKDGTETPVVLLDDTLRLRLDEPAGLPRNGYRQVRLSLDLRASTNAALAPALIGFRPAGSGTGSSAPASTPLNELKGIVLAKDELAGSLEVQAFLDDDLTRPLRRMQVRLAGGALLEDELDAPFADASTFFAALVEDATLVEVHGSQDAAGVVHAERIEIEDQVGGLDALEQVKIEGYVAAVDPLGSLRLFVQDVEQGLAVATAVLESLGEPSVIDATFDPGTTVFRERNQAATPAVLAVGQRVKIKFSDFLGSPFPARSVEVVAEAAFEAEILAVNGWSVELQARPDEFVVQGGLADADARIQADLRDARLVLQTAARPALSGVELRPGQSVTVVGTLAGPPDAPQVVDPAELRVVPGAFEGRMVSANPAGGRLQAAVRLASGFGHSVPVSSVVLRPETVYRGDARDEVELFALWSALDPGEHLSVAVEGVATDATNEVAAFVIEVVSH